MGSSSSRSRANRPGVYDPNKNKSNTLGAPPPYSAVGPPMLPPKPWESPPNSTSGSRHTSVLSNNSESSRTTRNNYLRAPMRQQTKEDALETLKKFDTVLIVDDSGSMKNSDLWVETRRALSALADTAGQYDADGIDIHFLNSPLVGRGMRNVDSVENLFSMVEPRGITSIGDKLEDLLRTYLKTIEIANKSDDPAALKRIKPVNFIVITDGAPTDDPETVIVQAAKRLDRGDFPITQVGIQFVQIGDDPNAAKYLKELDDELSKTHQIRDIVDTTPYMGTLNGDALIKILLGGVNRRVDKLGAAAIR